MPASSEPASGSGDRRLARITDRAASSRRSVRPITRRSTRQVGTLDVVGLPPQLARQDHLDVRRARDRRRVPAAALSSTNSQRRRVGDARAHRQHPARAAPADTARRSAAPPGAGRPGSCRRAARRSAAAARRAWCGAANGPARVMRGSAPTVIGGPRAGGIDRHRAELVDAKRHAAAADALLAEEHRARRIELDPRSAIASSSGAQQRSAPSGASTQVEQRAWPSASALEHAQRSARTASITRCDVGIGHARVDRQAEHALVGALAVREHAPASRP